MMQALSRLIVLAVVASAFLASTASAADQVMITVPQHGERVIIAVTKDPAGNLVNPKMQVRGDVQWSGKGLPRVQVQGVDVSAGAFTLGTNGHYSFIHEMHIPLDASLGGGTLPST